MKTEALTVWYISKHADTPWYTRALALFLVAYAFSPIDLIPDFIPVLGYVDDLVTLRLGVLIMLRMTPRHVIAECRMKARDHVAAQTGKPTSRLGKADVFSVAGHDHWVDTPISAGMVNDSDRPHVGFSVDASKMVVKPDPKVDAKTQAENSEG